MNLDFIKLETTGIDEYGPIYVFIKVSTIESISRYREVTNVHLVSGEHFVVKETPTEIMDKIQDLHNIKMETLKNDYRR